ncbi:MAG TPA: hypothetical protein VHC90_04000 [Bryobacteraceae bacterium]|nr:hypothetical protein [Bryobacteraceae bacterium]
MVTPLVEDILEQARNLSPAERASLIEALTEEPTPTGKRDSAYGKYPWLSSVDDFLREKHEETEREDP